ncbi:MAG: hypothetical protein Q7S83_01600 [bacterium]|nr:hypothetical protein [bacterium]
MNDNDDLPRLVPIPNIDEMVEYTKKNGGFFLKSLLINWLAKVRTFNSEYKICSFNPKNSEWAAQGGRGFPEPTVVYIGGSTWGGSMQMLGWVGVGMHLELTRLTGPFNRRVVTTSPIVGISLTENPQECMEIIEKARKTYTGWKEPTF